MVAAAHSAHSLVAVGKGKLGSSKALSLGKRVLRIGVVYACQEVVDLLVVGVYGNAEIAAPAQHGSYGAAAVLLGLAVEREHYVGTILVGILGTRNVVYLEYARHERLLGHLRLRTPVSMLVAYPHVTLPDGQEGTGILE